MKINIYILLLLFLGLRLVGQDEGESMASSKEDPIAMTVEDFKSKTKNKNNLVLVILKADWCVICKKQAPIIEEIKKENVGKVEVLIIDTKTNPLISDYFEVDGLPILILYKEGAIVWDHMGFQSKGEVMLEIKAAEYMHK